MRPSTIVLVGLVLALLGLGVFSSRADGGVNPGAGTVTLHGTGPVGGGPRDFPATCGANNITVEGWGYFATWSEDQGCYVQLEPHPFPKLYLNKDGTYVLIGDSSGAISGNGTWTKP